MPSHCYEKSDPFIWDRNPVLSLCFATQEVLTATLDLEDVRSYRAEISSRNLEVSTLGNTSLSAQPGLAGGPVCCRLDQSCGARDGAELWVLLCVQLLTKYNILGEPPCGTIMGLCSFSGYSSALPRGHTTGCPSPPPEF